MLRLGHSIQTQVTCVVTDVTTEWGGGSATSGTASCGQSADSSRSYIVADLSALSDGGYRIRLTVESAGGNSGGSVEEVINVVLDRTAPSASFASTAALLPKQAAAASLPALAIDFADPAALDCSSGCKTSPARLECRMDHAPEFGACDGVPASWSSWATGTTGTTGTSNGAAWPDTLALAAVLPGPHVLEIRAADLAGNAGPSSMWQWVAWPADSQPEPAFAVLPPTHHDPPYDATVAAFRPGGTVGCTLDMEELPLDVAGAAGAGELGEADLANLAPGVHTLSTTSGSASATFRWAVQTGPPVVTLQDPPGLGLVGYSRAAAWEVHLGSDVPVRHFVCRAGAANFTGGWEACCATAYGAESVCDTRCAIGSPRLAECGVAGDVWFSNCLRDQGAAKQPANSVAWSNWRISRSPVQVLSLLEELGADGTRDALDGTSISLECGAVPIAEQDPTAAGPAATASWAVLPTASANASADVEAEFAASEAAAAEACPETSKALVAFVVIGWFVLLALLLAAYYYREFLWAGWNPTQYRQKGLNVRTLEVTKEAPFQFVKTRTSAGKTQQAESKGSSGDTPVRLGGGHMKSSKPLHEQLSDPASEGYIDVRREESPAPQTSPRTAPAADWWDVDLGSAIKDAAAAGAAAAGTDTRASAGASAGAHPAVPSASTANEQPRASPPQRLSTSPVEMIDAADAAEVNSFFSAIPTVVPRRRSLSPSEVNSTGAQDVKALEAQAKDARRRSMGGFQVIKTRRASELGSLKNADAPEVQAFSIVTRRSPNASPPSDKPGAPRSTALKRALPNKRWSYGGP